MMAGPETAAEQLKRIVSRLHEFFAEGVTFTEFLTLSAMAAVDSSEALRSVDSTVELITAQSMDLVHTCNDVTATIVGLYNDAAHRRGFADKVREAGTLPMEAVHSFERAVRQLTVPLSQAQELKIAKRALAIVESLVWADLLRLNFHLSDRLTAIAGRLDGTELVLPILSLSTEDQDLILTERLAAALHNPKAYDQALQEIAPDRRAEVSDLFRNSIHLDLSLAHADLLWLVAATILESVRGQGGNRAALALQAIDNCRKFYISDAITPLPVEHYFTFERPGWTFAGLQAELRSGDYSLHPYRGAQYILKRSADGARFLLTMPPHSAFALDFSHSNAAEYWKQPLIWVLEHASNRTRSVWLASLVDLHHLILDFQQQARIHHAVSKTSLALRDATLDAAGYGTTVGIVTFMVHSGDGSDAALSEATRNFLITAFSDAIWLLLKRARSAPG